MLHMTKGHTMAKDRKYLDDKVLPIGTLFWAHLDAPSGVAGGEPKYSIEYGIPKDDPKLPALIAELEALANEAFGPRIVKQAGKPDTKRARTLADVVSPLQDGDAIADADESGAKDHYRGLWVIKAKRSTKFGRPLCVDRAGVACDPEVFYGGCKMRAKVSFFSNVRPEGNKSAIEVGLTTVQFVANGPRIGGGKPPSADGMTGDELPPDDYVEDEKGPLG